jgi:two-component system phosphate regulon sensor histidine kinase PhoR
MKQDYWRFAGVVFFSLVSGLITGQIFLCLFAGSVCFIYWQNSVLRHLLQWIRHRKDIGPPHMSGAIDEIAKEFDFLRMHHKQRKKKLSGYIKRFQDATRALPDAIVVLDKDGRIEWANDKAEEYLDIRTPQDTGQMVVNLIRSPDLVRYLGNPREHGADSGLETPAPGNPDLILELRLAPYGNKQKLLVARDITRDHRANQMRKDFIADASHELRTPLTVISGYLESFADEQDDKLKDWRQQIKQMRNQTGRMQRLIEDLLKLSSLETAGEINNKQVIRVPDLLNSIIEEARTTGSGVLPNMISIEADRELWLKGDRSLIYSAFSNLIFNAIQHTPESGMIIVRWFAEHGAGVLEVIDTGEGIAREHLPRITERFYRVDKGRSREKGGTGLGLAIVKHVLALHNAQLEIESEPGKGSTFRCRFTPEFISSRQEITGPALSA